jgi:hypothetical protein
MNLAQMSRAFDCKLRWAIFLAQFYQVQNLQTLATTVCRPSDSTINHVHSSACNFLQDSKLFGSEFGLNLRGGMASKVCTKLFLKDRHFMKTPRALTNFRSSI